MGNAPPQHHHTLHSASLDASATATPSRRRPAASQRRGTPGSAPTTVSDVLTTPHGDHDTDNEQLSLSLPAPTTPLPPSLSLPALTSSPDDDIVHTLGPKCDPTTASARHPLLAALDALPLTEPLSSTLDPPSIDHQPADSPYHIDRIDRIDARAVEELLRLCRQYVKDDVNQLLADQRDIARRLDSIEDEFNRLPAALRSMNDDIRLMLQQLNNCQLSTYQQFSVRCAAAIQCG